MTFPAVSHRIDTINITIPFPSRISPDLDRARACHLAWVAELGLWPAEKADAYRATDFPQMMSRGYPWAVGADLQLVTDFISWSWVWDDSLDRPGKRAASVTWTADILDAYRQVLYGRRPRIPDFPLLTAWRQLLARLAERTSEDWRHRHEEHWEYTYSGYLREAENNANGYTPAYEEYLDIRRGACGVNICIDLIEPVGRYELPPHIHTNADLLSLRQDTEDVPTLVNDILSVPVEWDAGNTDNIVPVLAKQERCSWSQAAHYTEEIIDSTLNHFQQTEKTFIASPDYLALDVADRANTDHFINAMKDLMRGCVEWQLNCPRYSRLERPLPGRAAAPTPEHHPGRSGSPNARPGLRDRREPGTAPQTGVAGSRPPEGPATRQRRSPTPPVE